MNIFLSLFPVKDEPSETDNLTNQLASDFKSEFKAEDIKNFDENLLGGGGNGENLIVLYLMLKKVFRILTSLSIQIDFKSSRKSTDGENRSFCFIVDSIFLQYTDKHFWAIPG